MDHSDWQASLNPALTRRLLRPTTQPGSIDLNWAKGILTRYQSPPNPLVSRLLQRQQRHSLEGNVDGNTPAPETFPIVVATDAVPVMAGEPMGSTPSPSSAREHNLSSSVTTSITTIDPIHPNLDPSLPLETIQSPSSLSFPSQSSPSLSSSSLSSPTVIQAKFEPGSHTSLTESIPLRSPLVSSEKFRTDNNTVTQQVFEQGDNRSDRHSRIVNIDNASPQTPSLPPPSIKPLSLSEGQIEHSVIRVFPRPGATNLPRESMPSSSKGIEHQSPPLPLVFATVPSPIQANASPMQTSAKAASPFPRRLSHPLVHPNPLMLPAPTATPQERSTGQDPHHSQPSTLLQRTVTQFTAQNRSSESRPAPINMDVLASKIERRLTRKLMTERERRGLPS